MFERILITPLVSSIFFMHCESLVVSFSCIVNKITWRYRSRGSPIYFKIGALNNFSNFTGKIHVLESLFEKASDTQICKFIQKRLQHRYFPVKLARFSSTFFTEHFQWVVFKISNSNILLKDFSGTASLLSPASLSMTN